MALQSFAELDVFRCALDGIGHIEASAGTGKTWSICALYIRFLLEKDLSTDKILVVTFTKAAASELYNRIREKLVQLEHTFKARDTASDPFIIYLLNIILDPTSKISLEMAKKRINRALRTFDHAQIYTIHTFCHRTLQHAPFSSGAPFSFNIVNNDSTLRFDLASDFWHRRVEPVANQEPEFATWLIKSGIGPSTLDEQLTRWLKTQLSSIPYRLSEISKIDNNEEMIVTRCFVVAAQLWSIEYNNIETLLKSIQPILNHRSHNPEAIFDALSAWNSYFARSNIDIKELPKAALKLTRTALVKATKKGSFVPKHPFFDLAESLEVALINAEVTQRKRWIILVTEWLNEAPNMLALRKRTQGLLTFDDLLIHLYDVLQKQSSLREILRTRYRATLIDEFQDIDSLQFKIFDQIFIQAGGPLFFVGDPKQAIYSFRGADLHPYFAFYSRASACYKLSINYRSIPTIAEACNRFFGSNTQAFVLDKLHYHHIRASCHKHRQLIDETDDTSHTGDFRIWMLPDGDRTLYKRDAQWYAAQACASEIKRLIQGAHDGRVRLGETKLLPKDIVVLVQTHRQGRLMKRALTMWRISSTEFTQASVFSTIDAQNFERVLAAIDSPNDLLRLRSALSIDWLNLNAANLWQINQSVGKEQDILLSGRILSSDTMSIWIKRFSHYQLLWKKIGFSAMWHRLFNELKIAECLINIGIDSERRITDINHLAELIQIRASEQPGILSTICWLTARRMDGGGDDAYLRLASDRNLVQILTIHKSKGLEYAIIFCPFLSDGMLREQHSTSLLQDIYTQDIVKHTSQKAILDQGAENIRLIYVALTRAIYRCYLVAGPYLSSRSTRESRRSMMNWLIAGNEKTFNEWIDNPPDNSTLAKAWRMLSGGPISITPLPIVVNKQKNIQSNKQPQILVARRAFRILCDEWKIASFSSITASSIHIGINDPTLIEEEFRPDYDISIDIIESSEDADTKPYQDPVMIPNDDILMFPSSAEAGKCLHRLFELSNFNDASSWLNAASSALRDYPVQSTPELDKYLPSMMVKLVNDVVHTELIPGFRMADLSQDRRLNEISFLFPVRSLDLSALRLLIIKYGYSDIMLNPGIISGFLRGFIDMIIKNDDRFWIVDWKSKHIGYTQDAYSEHALDSVMTDHAYHLQALIYIVALHRFLRNRLKNYNYDLHIAGYMYLFIRGIRPSWKSKNKLSGIYTRRPARKLIYELDRIIGGE
ncbi:MAG: exodeoxyribonuclease V subunit beta [Burkholderia sp.]|nr:exodeoxyribonuclease V subunit beta [Burkholderia sp.]